MVEGDADTFQCMDANPFSDEKKGNINGLDGLQHYWRDMRVCIKQTNCLQMDGGSGMVKVILVESERLSWPY